MSNYIVTNATTLSDETVDIEIRDGRIDRIFAAVDGDPSRFDPDRRFDADGRLVTSSFSEPHIHLDTPLTAGEPRWNESGTLREGIGNWAERKESLTKAGVKKRASRTLEWLASHGVTQVRAHVDTTESTLTGVEAVLELREEFTGFVDVEIAGFPQDGLIGDGANLDNLREALDMGVDVVGGIPHNERTREGGVDSIQTITDLAEEYDAPVDPHIDETDDPGSRFTEVLAHEAMERGIGDRTAASHTTAMHSHPDPYVDKLIPLIAESGMSVITNPAVNAILQGRGDGYPRIRGHARIDQLREAGVTVAMGHDSVMDPWYHYGIGDPIDMAYVLVHYAHMNGYDDVGTLWEMMLQENAEILELESPSLEPGSEGSLVVFDARDPFTVLRKRSPRLLVLKEGRPIAETTPSTTQVYRDGDERTVEYLRE